MIARRWRGRPWWEEPPGIGIALACPLSDWSGQPKRCRWCNAHLSGRRTAWCSDACAHTYAANHSWPLASRTAKDRDGWTCRRCGADGSGPPEAAAWHAILTMFCPLTRLHVGFREWLAQRGRTIDDLDDADHQAFFRSWSKWRQEEYRRWRDAHATLARHARAFQLETDHVAPVFGAHDLDGCMHHQTNLVCLCRNCHLVATSIRRAA